VALSEGSVIRSGEGRRGSPYLFEFNEFDSRPNPVCENSGTESEKNGSRDSPCSWEPREPNVDNPEKTNGHKEKYGSQFLDLRTEPNSNSSPDSVPGVWEPNGTAGTAGTESDGDKEEL